MPPPPDDEALEAAAWGQFVRRLGAHFAAQWPAMPERLGERYDAFVDLAVQQALQRGIEGAAAVARFVNLWFVWGPAYHDKPGFEWAQGILAAPAGRDWLVVHQLVQRSLAELKRLPGTRIEPQALAAADARAIEAFAVGRRGAMRQAEPPPLPRLACDVEAAELKLLDEPPRLAYRLAAGEWTREPLPPPAPLRVDAARPLPGLVALLSAAPGDGAPARLQVRVKAHAVCDGDVHPALWCTGPSRRLEWQGHETRAASWPLAARAVEPAPFGPGSRIAEETSPELYKLEVHVCGLRDEGDALGPLKTMAGVWPAAQWWLECQRAVAPAQPLLPGPRSWNRGTTRCRVERDGATLDAAPLKTRFEQGLDAACGVALQKLAAAWEQLPGLAQPALEAQLGLLVGRAALAWGWCAPVLDAAPFMRLAAQLDLEACRAELAFGGEWQIGGSRCRVGLRVAGVELLRTELRREDDKPPLAALLPRARAAWRFPFVATLDPLAGDTAALAQATGPATGALVGEAGLRPNTHGASGWEWYATLRLEAVTLPVVVADPLLGETASVQALLAAQTLLDWSLGDG